MDRKKYFQVLSAALALLLLASCGACGVSQSAGEPASAAPAKAEAVPAMAASTSTQAEAEPEEAVELFPAGLDLPVGKSIVLTAEIRGTEAVEWSSSDPAAVSVSGDGTVSALSGGEALITVSTGGVSDICRITATDGTSILAYQQDPGPRNGGGVRDRPDGQGDNIPILVPDGQEKIDKSLFGDPEYSWQFQIHDGFDTRLSVPSSSISYMVNCHIDLSASKVGGDSLMGDYKGTMDMKMAIDDPSFLSAMQAAGIPATDVNSAFQVQTVNVEFTVVLYDADDAHAAKNAYLPAGETPVVPLTQIAAMAISSAKTSTSGNIDLEAGEGFGSAALTDEAGEIPIVIEAYPDGSAVLYLPKMLSMSKQDSFTGALARMRLIDLP